MRFPPDISLMLVPVFQAILAASWQGSLAVGLVLLVRQVLGARVPARWHYLLWFLVLGRLLVPAFVLPHSPASLENIPAVAAPFGKSPAPVMREAASDDLIVLPLPRELSPRLRSAAPIPAPHPPSRPHPWSWWMLAGSVWLVGAIGFGGWLMVCSILLGRQVRKETFAPDPAIAEIWRSCCRRWLRRAPPRVLVGDWVPSPALVGVWRPKLLLPRQLRAAFSPSDWEHVFAHEIAHLRWYDHWSQLLLHLAWCAHWFNPVVWFSLRRLRADRELAADDWVLRHLTGERSLAYGETLFKTVANRPAVGFSFQQGLVGISEDGAQMKQRLQRITAFLPRRQVYGSLAGLAALLLLGTVVLGQGSSTHDTGETTHPAPSPAPVLAHQLTIKPEIKKTFVAGEGIDIRQITGTNASFQVGGTYRVTGVCRQHTLKNATLYLGNTADAGADAIVPALGTSLSKPLPPGSTEFDFTFQLLRPGVVHVTVYDLDNPDKKDNAYAGVELGTVAVPAVAVENAVGPTKPAPPTALGVSRRVHG
jgi:beta-lactamase regulating signal transducer with metallopeptidase domain